jgi:hypothetical protein
LPRFGGAESVESILSVDGERENRSFYFQLQCLKGQPLIKPRVGLIYALFRRINSAMSDNPSLADVRARRAEIAKIIEPLQAEERELAAVEAVLVRRFGSTPPAGPTPATASSVAPQGAEKSDDDEEFVHDVVKRKMKGNETIEELILMSLDECSEDWWTAAQMQENLKEIKGREVPMSSVSPTLSNMKNRGLIVRDGLNFALPARAKTNEAAAK